MIISTACHLKHLFIPLLNTYFKDETYESGLHSNIPAEHNTAYVH